MPVPLETVTSRWYALARAREALHEFLLPTQGRGLLTQMMEQGDAGGNSIPLGGEESFG